MSITLNNINYVRSQINLKNSSTPYYAYDKTIRHVVDDMDSFPYHRFYRGVYWKDKPVIFEREAGYRKRHDNCYKPKFNYIPNPKPKHCFEGPCSVVYPCYPEYLRKYADKDELEIMLNKTCVSKSP
tara:strand:- start:3729 stop:4109 length:381 start_codon:yes stop_codon:yes gene_type:complete